MPSIQYDFQQDINDITLIPGIDTLLKVVCEATGMGFAAIARVTEDRWITCSTNDTMGFGLKPGNELEIKTTICNEIREATRPVVINCVKEDPIYHNHHTPATYGFQSYISVPIFRKNGDFFGTLCAIDPSPKDIDNIKIRGMFDMFTELISFHLNAAEILRISEKKILEEQSLKEALESLVRKRTHELEEKNVILDKMNKELQSFAYISSHDLQEPLRKIQTIASAIIDQEEKNLSDKGKDYFRRMQNSANRMQALINDLIAYSKAGISERNYKFTDLTTILEETESELADDLISTGAQLEYKEMCRANVVPFQIRQLMMNLVNNSIKFRDEQRPLVIRVISKIANSNDLNYKSLSLNKDYCHISVTDNGIGFENKFGDRIFELFQRLHDRAEYKGTGIGLAIVKKIVDNHNGFIQATGIPGRGARFDIYLPVEQDSITA